MRNRTGSSAAFVIVALTLAAMTATGQTVTKKNNTAPANQDTATSSTDGRLGLGSSGKDDDVGTFVGSVIKDDDGTYKLWYTGRNSAYYRIYRATSPDGLAWTKTTNVISYTSDTISSNGCIPRGSGTRGDGQHTFHPWVIKDGTTYKMWYQGNHSNTGRIYYATSPDGLTWTKTNNVIPTASSTNSTDGRIPLGLSGSGDSGGVSYPCVIKDGTTYRMWYTGALSGTSRIYHATSDDGLTWTKVTNGVPEASNTNGTLGRIPLGTSGSDVKGVWAPCVVRTPTGYRMWYTGMDASNKERVYSATSSNGLDWVKTANTDPPTSDSGDTPGTLGRIGLGTNGKGDDYYVTKPAVLLETNMPYRIWYTGSDGGVNYRIYYAEMERGPALTNQAFVSATDTNADLACTLALNESDPARVFVYWGATDGVTNAANWSTNADWGVKSLGATFTNTITGLFASGTYYFRFFASNAPGTAWASTSGVFVTTGPFTVGANAATGISGVNATLNGAVSGGNPTPSVYACWGSTNGGTVSTSGWANVRSLGPQATSFSTTLTNLWTANQTNYYAFFGTNGIQGAWSAVSNFVSDAATVTVGNNATDEPPDVGDTTPASFPVTLNRASAVDVSFTVTTSNGTAVGGSDFVATNGTFTIAAGVTATSFPVLICGDAATEANGETYTLIFTNAAGVYLPAGPAYGLILDPGGAFANTWVGLGADDNWSTDANWFYNRAPTNPWAGTIRFDQTDSGGTVRLDPETLTPATNVWQIGGLTVANSSATAVNFQHLHDLNGNRLLVDGDVSAGSAGAYSSCARAHFTNGTLQVGTTNQARSLTIGAGTVQTTSRAGELKVCPGAVFEPYIGVLQIGQGLSGAGVLDLRGATVASGVLDVQDLKFATDGHGSTDIRTLQLLLDATTGLQEIRVRHYFDFPYHQMYTARIGDPANEYKLPPNVSFTVGSEASRGRFLLAYAPYNSGVSVQLEATSGGQFIAYLTELTVHRGYFGSGATTSLLDLRAMTNVLIDISGEFSIGKTNSTDAMRYNSTVRLGTGTVACATAVIGTSTATTSKAFLELNGTDFTATSSLTVGIRGVITNVLTGVSGGLDLPATCTLDVQAGGRIGLAFLESAPPTQDYWGLRWEGDHAGELQALLDASRIVSVHDAVGRPPFIFSADGYTCIGYRKRSTVIMIR